MVADSFDVFHVADHPFTWLLAIMQRLREFRKVSMPIEVFKSALTYLYTQFSVLASISLSHD